MGKRKPMMPKRKIKKRRNIIKEFIYLYFAKTRDSSERNFYAWLEDLCVDPNIKAWEYILDHPEEYGLK